MALLVAGAAGMKAAIVTMKIHLQKLPIHAKDGLTFPSLPTETANWRREGRDEVMSAEVLETLGTQNYVSRVYVEKSPPGDRPARALQLHCAYYTGTIDTVPHVPERCFVGGGMSIDGATKIVRIPLDMGRFPVDDTVDATVHGGEIRQGRLQTHAYVRMPRELDGLKMNVTSFRDAAGRRLNAGYFFLANGGHVPTANDVRQLAFKLQDSYSYYAKVQVLSSQVESADELAELAAEFLNEMLPDIVRRTPDWVEVVEGRYPEDRADGKEKRIEQSAFADGPHR